MKLFVAGASGAIGRRLVPLLVAVGHEVVAMTHAPRGSRTLPAQARWFALIRRATSVVAGREARWRSVSPRSAVAPRPRRRRRTAARR